MSIEAARKNLEDAQKDYDEALHEAYVDILTLLNKGYEFFWRTSNLLCWARPDQHDSSYDAPEEWAWDMKDMIRIGLVHAVPATSPIQLAITWKGKDLLKRFGEKYIFEGLK